MSEFSNFLPLSQRRYFDEGQVSGDWRPVTAQCLTLLVEVLAAQQPDAWNAPSLRTGWSVRQVAAELLWRCESSRLELAVERFGAVFRDSLHREHPHLDIARLAEAHPDELLNRMSTLAMLRSQRVGRRGIGDLSDVVSRTFEISRALGVTTHLPAVATGAVCLARILTAPLPVRAALAGRSLTATDAEWTVGHGRPIAAPAEEHVLFLFGRRKSLPGT